MTLTQMLKAMIYVVPILSGIVLVVWLIIRQQNKEKEALEAAMTQEQKERLLQTRPAAAPAGKGENINAPMPGNILDVRVANGQAVTAGQILMILEAMKMENEIIAPCAGTVSNLSVHKGSTVSSGQLLCSIG